MPLVRQRKKDRKASKDIENNVEINQNALENECSVKEPEIKKILGDKTKSSIKKKQKITKKRRNDNKYDRVYNEFII
tara:strand:+ start:724 stop:954 length:231 start_codon:yes stop_codon:yes gene_type:complete